MFRKVMLAQGTDRAFRSHSLPVSDLDEPDLGEPSQGWGSMTWAEYGALVDQLAAAFVQWGVGPGDRVAILSENRWEWHVADVATMMVGAISVPVYPTSSISQTRYVLEHSAAKLCVVSNLDQFRKVVVELNDDSTLQHLVLMNEDGDVAKDAIGEMRAADDLRIKVWTWQEAIAFWPQSSAPNDEVDKRRSSIHETDIATIVYTSGTTGPPKGVMLTHRNIVETIDMIRSVGGPPITASSNNN